MAASDGQYNRRNAVYLHYLDRELTDAAGHDLNDLEIIRITRLLTVMTQSELYCGLSAIWENNGLGPYVHLDFELLLCHHELQTVSRDVTLGEFRASRQVAYRHDMGRYPNYFTPAGDRLNWLGPTWQKQSGSTVPLVREIQSWIERLPTVEHPRFQSALGALQKPMKEALYRREVEAVTYSYFKDFLGDLIRNPHAEYAIRRQISRGFTIDNQRHGGGDIVTGIPELQLFDSLALDFPHHDVRLLGELSVVCGLGPAMDALSTDVSAWRQFVVGRSGQRSQLLAGVVRWILAALFTREKDRIPSPSDDRDRFYGQHQMRTRMIAAIRAASRTLAHRAAEAPVAQAEDAVERAYNQLTALAARLSSADRKLGEQLESTRETIAMARADVVLVTVNEIETEELRNALEHAGHHGTIWFGPINTYWLYGPIGNAMVAHVRCTMGSGGQAGSTLSVTDAIRDLSPTSVIGVGVAFGIDEAKQPIGQLLLSQRLSSYELQRVGTGQDRDLEARPRGPSQECSPRLLGRFRDTSLSTLGIKVLAGEVLSGEKLVDNSTFKAALVKQYPEAIGGEMEGAGVQAASGRANVDWLVVKSVCDYAENKAFDKEARQREAGRVAATAVLRVLADGGLATRG